MGKDAVNWHRAVVTVFLAVQIAGLSACQGLLVFALDTRGLISEAQAATSKPACPAREFSSFVEAFAESATIQRQYTRLPLVYGHLDQNLVGTARENKAFSRRIINSFEAIPLFDPADGGRIFSSKMKIAKKEFEMEVKTPPEYPGNHTIATIFTPDAGFRLHYRFIKSGGCWTLIGIDDRSI